MIPTTKTQIRGGCTLPGKGKKMNHHTMVKFTATGECVALQTISRTYRSPHRFFILEKKFRELEHVGALTVRDLHSFAELRLYEAKEGKKMLEITFFWLNAKGNGGLYGQEERIALPYERFLRLAEESQAQGGETKRLLSHREQHKPKIEFYSRSNLQDVVQRKELRHKLGKFLDRHFNWPDAMSIQISDDFVPYSFFFTEKRATGNGLCGGIILHGQEDLKKAYYGMHT